MIKRTEFVRCQICREPDMRAELYGEAGQDSDDGWMVHCTNLACPSNAVDEHLNAALPADGAFAVGGEDLVYAPGQWCCNKCGMRLFKNYFSAETGSVAVDRSTDDVECMNGCGMMRRLTWKEDAEAANRVGMDLFKQVDHLQQRLFELEPNN